MKNIFLSLVIICLSAQITFSQQKNTTYYVISFEGKNQLTKNLWVAPPKITEMDVVSRPDIAKYYSGNVNNIVLIKVKADPAIRLVNLNEFFNRYKINGDNRLLAINIDNTEIKDPSDLLIDLSSIQSVKIIDKLIVVKTDIYELNRRHKAAKG